MTKKTFNGKEYEVYTMQDWERDMTLKVQVGQAIEPAIYWQLLCSVPPKQNGYYFQPGEAYDWDFEHCCQRYSTFQQLEGDYYLYIGLRA